MKTYGKINLINNEWILSALEPHVSIKLKSLFTGIPKYKTPPYEFSNSPEACADLSWFFQRYKLEISEDNLAELQRNNNLFYSRQAEIEAILTPAYVPKDYELKDGRRLRAYQSQAIEVFKKNKSLLVGDEVGLGKSYVGIGAVLEKEQRPAIIVVPTHLTRQWKEKIEEFSSLKVHIIKGTRPYSLPEADVYIMKYSCLSGWTDIFLTGFFKTVVFDEVQDLRRGTESDKGRAANVLTANTEYRCGLSVGPDTIIALHNGPFKQGWIGTIEDAWLFVGELRKTQYEGSYETIDVESLGIKTRGWMPGGGWGWKTVKKLIRHICDKTTHSIKAAGRNLLVTSDHSIFIINNDGIQETQTASILKGDAIPLDNGYAWECAQEIPLDTTPLVRYVSRCQAVVDLSATNRAEMGLTKWQWQNCHREATYGTRLPIQVYLKHKDRLGKPSLYYLGRGKAPALPTEVFLSEWAYVLGFYLGNGWVSDNTRACFAAKPTKVSGVCAGLKQLGIGLDPKTRKMAGNSYEVRCSHRLFSILLTNVFRGAYCYEKRIPGEWIVSWPRKARENLLQGLMDSDGHLSNSKKHKLYASYATTSKLLADDILSLLCSLGIAGGIHQRKPARGGVINGRRIVGKRPAYSVYWSGHQMNGNAGGRCGSRHRHKWTRGITNEAAVTLNNISTPPALVYDLEVDGHPSFSVNGLLAHNSATPMYNFGDEIWNIMDILKSGCLGSKEEFIREWGGGDRVIKEPKALGTYLREKHLFLRRTRDDVGQYLQPVNTIVETVGYDELAVKSIEDLAIKLAIKASRGSFVERGMAARELDIMVRQATGISKAKYVAEFVKIILENNEPVLLVGWHRACYEIWLNELDSYNPVMYTGSESETQKNNAKNAFVNGDSNLMIMSLRSGVGLDGIQKRCSTVVFGELDYSPGIHHQVTGRLDREGQTRQVMAIYLCSESGSDPLIIDLLGLKSSQAQGILDPSLGVQSSHSDNSRIQLLVQKYLRKAGIDKPTQGNLPIASRQD